MAKIRGARGLGSRARIGLTSRRALTLAQAPAWSEAALPPVAKASTSVAPAAATAGVPTGASFTGFFLPVASSHPSTARGSWRRHDLRLDRRLRFGHRLTAP